MKGVRRFQIVQKRSESERRTTVSNGKKKGVNLKKKLVGGFQILPPFKLGARLGPLRDGLRIDIDSWAWDKHFEFQSDQKDKLDCGEVFKPFPDVPRNLMPVDARTRRPSPRALLFLSR